MKKISAWLLPGLFLAVQHTYAQHEHHHSPTIPADTVSAPARDTAGHADMEEMTTMTHAFSRHLPMTRNGSGTSWLPDATPMYAYMKHTPQWMYMIHGSAFLRYNRQDIGKSGTRGGDKLDLPNMFMVMGQRNVGAKGLFRFSTMFSLDPFTVGESGYPLLFQSGESYRGQPLVDRQHPHDLFSELSIAYTQSFNPDVDAYVYVGYPGEPALGPPAFMHRISAFSNPDAPLSHHWQDATHITFGVATVGFRYRQWKIEGSSFTGREPDENRYNFDKPRFDSRSYRLSFNPSSEWALQFSQGWLKSPELLEASENVNRTTASAIYSRNMGRQSFLTTSAVWGMNQHTGTAHAHGATHSILLESQWQVGKIALYGRYEWVQKSPGELSLEDQFEAHSPFGIHALTLGVNYLILQAYSTNLAFGVQGTVFAPDADLAPLYGKSPVSAEVYLRLTPALWRGTTASKVDPAHAH